MLKRFGLLFIACVTAVLSGCTHHASPIPVIDFFKTPEKVAYRISPDGKYISYLKPYKDKQNLFIQSLDGGKEQMATSFTDYSVRGDYNWTYNNDIVFFQDDIAQDEIKMFTLDIESLKVTPIISQKK